MAARTFYADQASGKLMFAEGNDHTPEQLAAMAADKDANIDALAFHTDFQFIKIVGSVVNNNGFTSTELTMLLEEWSDGGGGGKKIICTKLYELGYMPVEIYIADQKFGEYLQKENPDAYWGYIKWATVVVDWMEGSGPNFMFWIRDKEKRHEKQRNFFINLTKRIATPWAYHMAYKMGVVKDDNRAGRLIMKSGLAISKLVGKFTRKDKEMNPIVAYTMLLFLGVYFRTLSGVK
jgi:hypothetical protein